jgi:hypothetical protein
MTGLGGTCVGVFIFGTAHNYWQAVGESSLSLGPCVPSATVISLSSLFLAIDSLLVPCSRVLGLSMRVDIDPAFSLACLPACLQVGGFLQG